MCNSLPNLDSHSNNSWSQGKTLDSADYERAARRLAAAPWPSRTTEAAQDLTREAPSEAALIQKLTCPRTAPAVLEVWCAMEPKSEAIFGAVRQRISHNPSLSWALVESLHRLPWYDGMRAFLSLPGHPTSSTSVYPFYILARNKIFIPPDMSGEVYRYHADGLYLMASLARTGDWGSPHGSVIAVLRLMRRHLDTSAPDLFVAYLSCLMLGCIGPLGQSIQVLSSHTRNGSDATVKEVAALTLAHLGGSPASAPMRLTGMSA